MQTKVKEMRERAGLTQKQLADALGITQQSVYYYESGDRDIKSSTLIDMSRILGCTVTELLGLGTANIIQLHACKSYHVPVFGRIAAGTPREALCQSDTMHDTPASIYEGRRNAFWLTVSGNSMNRLFPDGSLVLIDPDEEVCNGDVAVVFVNGDDATLKRIYHEGDSIRLHPESYDPEYRDRVIDATDPDAPEVRVIGKAVSYTAPEGWRA